MHFSKHISAAWQFLLPETKFRIDCKMHTNGQLAHWGRDEMNNISQTTFSNVFSSMKMFEFWFKFHWSLFPRVQFTVSQHWFRLWLGAVQATSHYLNQWWLVYRHICVTRPYWVNWTDTCRGIVHINEANFMPLRKLALLQILRHNHCFYFLLIRVLLHMFFSLPVSIRTVLSDCIVTALSRVQIIWPTTWREYWCCLEYLSLPRGIYGCCQWNI